MEQNIITADELAKKFEVTRRTIYRDIETINLAGIPIVSYPGVRGGIGIIEKYKFDKRLFTTADISTLLTGLGVINTAISSQEVMNTIAKVKGLIPNNQREEIETLSNQFSVDLSPWTKDKNAKKYMQLINLAINKHNVIHFKYTDSKGETTARDVEPYRLIHKRSCWYMQGYCYLLEEFKLFRFSRMERIAVSEKTFAPRQYDIHLVDTFNPTVETQMITVKLRIDKRYKRNFIICFGENSVQLNEKNQYIATIEIPNSQQGYNSLLSLPDNCECLSPESARNYVINKLKKLNNLYKIT